MKQPSKMLSAVAAMLWLATPLLSCAPQELPYDPYRAEKNLEIGMFYLKKKNYDAAIERFQESIRYKPNFARPHRLIAEAYEKKGEKAEAVNYYQKYLEILPQAEDAAKVRRRIEKLTRELERQRARRKRSSH